MKWMEGWATEDKICEDIVPEIEDRNGEHSWRVVKLNEG
jgi:hypothetical protein